MWYGFLILALVAQVALGAIHKPGSKFLDKYLQNGSKYENGRGPYYFESGQEGGLTAGRNQGHQGTSSGTSAGAQDMITEYRFQGPTTSGVTTGCLVTMQPGKRKQTTYFVIDTTGEEQVVIKGGTVRLTFPGPSFFPGLIRTNTVYFHEMCFPAQCASRSCGFVTGPVTSIRTSVDLRQCPPPVTPPPNPVPCDNDTGTASADPDPPSEGIDTPINPDNPGNPALEPDTAGSQPANSLLSPPKPDFGENPTQAPVNSTKLLAKPEPCPEDKNATQTPDPCPEEAKTPSKPSHEKPATGEPLPVPPRSRPSSSSFTSTAKPIKPIPTEQPPPSTQNDDIITQLQKLLSMAQGPQQPQRAPPSSSGNNFLVSTASETQVTTTDPTKTTAEEAEVYYSGLPGAVRGHTGAIYYPSCSASAYRQVAITPFCDARRLRNRRTNVFSETVPSEDLQLFGL